VTEELYKKFNKVIGTDPSEKMLSAVQLPPAKDGKPPIEYKVATAEDLSFIQSNSVDMVTAGQAAHWFNHEKSMPELARILKPGGTLAFFCTFPFNWDYLTVGYGDLRVAGRPELTTILRKYSYGGPGTMGPYWEEPGRSIVVNVYRDIIPPEALFKDVTRHFFPRQSPSGETEVIVEIRRKMTIAHMRPYTRTWSSYHGWSQAFPERKSRESGGEGDIIDDMFDALKSASGFEEDTEFDVEWVSGILLARKKDL